MTLCFATNENNDIFLGPDGNLAFTRNIFAIETACACAAKSQLGEMLFAADQGVANFETIWRNAANVAQFEASARAAILSVPGVTGIKNFDVTVAGNKVTYFAVIQTIYGTGRFNGGV